MRYFVISDNTDTHVGLRLAGIEGVIARTREEGLAALDKALSDGHYFQKIVDNAQAAAADHHDAHANSLKLREILEKVGAADERAATNRV